jgi:transglutaminase-like putative cysteine protease
MTAAIRYRVTHVTRYVYSEAVSLCHNVARLTPRPAPGQVLHESALRISPLPAIRSDHRDWFQNPTTNFTIQEPHRELKLTATHDISVTQQLPPRASPPWEWIRDHLAKNIHLPNWLDALQFRFASPAIPIQGDYAAYAQSSFPAQRPIVEAVSELTQSIHREFAYDPRATNVTTTVAEVFQQRRGVCQDFAHFQLACLRSLGLAARYVSGYLSTTPPPGRARVVGADASHAWIAVFCGELGWVAFDPTNPGLPTDRYIVLAWGRDYQDVSPVKGVILGGGHHRVEVSVDASPVPEP